MSASRRITAAFPQATAAGSKSVKDAEKVVQPARGIKTSLAEAGPSTPGPAEIDADEKILRTFDLQSKYGPVSGLSRLERFQRAEKLGLAPPQAVKELILKHGEDSALNEHLFTVGKV
jgi:DNA polymerase delta subunit 4